VVELLGPGPGGDVIVRHGFLMGDSPSPKATVYGPSGHSRCTRASGPGFDGGRARSGARSTAFAFCAGVLCGSCVAPRLPRGPASWRRELDPRGALRLATDAGPLAGLNECAFNRLCVCGRGSSAPTRVCSDAQICSLSWVSIGLEPASDGSGRYAHLPGATAQGLRLRRRRRLSPPAPRPAALAAGPVRHGSHLCGRPAHDGPGRYAPALA
jgi:hypothetical protein